jgi:hypothetical protein
LTLRIAASGAVEATFAQECNRLVDGGRMGGKSGVRGPDRDVIRHAVEFGALHRTLPSLGLGTMKSAEIGSIARFPATMPIS